MTDTIDKALKLALAEFKKDIGENAKLEEGDSFITVFNDAVITISMEPGRGLKVDISVGKPYFVDFDLDLLEERDG